MNDTLSLPDLLHLFRSSMEADSHFLENHLYQLTFQSTALEGSSLSLGQTRELLQPGNYLVSEPTPHQWMVLDHHQALTYCLTLANQHQPINLSAIQQLAALVMNHTGGFVHTLLDSFDTSKGEWRTRNATADRKQLIDARTVPAALQTLFNEINTSVGVCKTSRQQYTLSFRAQQRLLEIHPFGEGNGRVARLLMNYVQQYCRLPLCFVSHESRNAYRQALLNNGQKPGLFSDFMFAQLNRGLMTVCSPAIPPTHD